MLPPSVEKLIGWVPPSWVDAQMIWFRLFGLIRMSDSSRVVVWAPVRRRLVAIGLLATILNREILVFDHP